MVQIVLLNMLIAIMGNTFSKVKKLGDKTMLKEYCLTIADNDFNFILDREKEFQNSKYLIIAKLENSEMDLSSNLEMKLAHANKSMEDNIKHGIEAKLDERFAHMMKEINGELKALGNKTKSSLDE
jgi:hypothetical protein